MAVAPIEQEQHAGRGDRERHVEATLAARHPHHRTALVWVKARWDQKGSSNQMREVAEADAGLLLAMPLHEAQPRLVDLWG